MILPLRRPSVEGATRCFVINTESAWAQGALADISDGDHRLSLPGWPSEGYILSLTQTWNGV